MKKFFLCTFLFFVAALTKAQITFDYTGSEQFYVVPACVDSITVDVMGAEGGFGPSGCTSNTFKYGGKGGRVQATIPVTPGDTLFIFVGGKGEDDDLSSALGGYNGGGDAMAEDQYSYYGGGGGGGASDIRLNGIALGDRIIVAGGGGGAGSDGCSCEPLYGGDGGDLTGEAGEAGIFCLCDPSGQGGTQSAGGAKGDWECVCDAEDGSLGQGGNSNSTFCGGPTGGGGGGGGYYGGGGGGLGAGGGGSSYNFSSASDVTHTQGYQSGNGQVVISSGGLTLSVTVIPNDSVCSGTEVTLSGNGADAYFWDNGIEDGVPFTATTSNTYTVIGINAQDCTDSLQFNLFVYPSVSVDFSIPGADTICSFAENLSLVGSPGGGTFTGAGVTGNSFDPGSADIEAWNVISYTGTDVYGCSYETHDSIYVASCVGIGNVTAADQQVNIYPNPSDGNYTIETPVNGDAIIYNVLGEVIFTQHMIQGIHQINIEKVPAGIYTLKFIGTSVQLKQMVKN